MLIKTEAVVLRALKYGDGRLIVDLFTREAGRLSVAVGLSTSRHGKMRKQLFQPMTLLAVEVDVRPRVQLQRLRDVRLLLPLPSLVADASKCAIVLFVAEFLYHGLRAEQCNVPLFDYIVDAVRWLDGCDTGYANFHLVFLLRLSRFLGFYPNLDGYEEGSVFDLRAGVFCTVVPLHRDFLPPDEAGRAALVMRMDFATMHLFRMSRQERGRLLDIVLSYYRLHLPDFPVLKSVEVLKEVYND